VHVSSTNCIDYNDFFKIITSICLTKVYFFNTLPFFSRPSVILSNGLVAIYTTQNLYTDFSKSRVDPCYSLQCNFERIEDFALFLDLTCAILIGYFGEGVELRNAENQPVTGWMG